MSDVCSKIYCDGEILHDIQLARVYPDSKTFVDKKLLFPESEIVQKYQQLKSSLNGAAPSLEQLKSFIDENFADDPLEQWDPPDFKHTPSLLNNVEDKTFRKWILNLNQIWKDLAGRVPQDVKANPDRHSILYMPNGFIKAGGRFREMYYWDSYWIVRGLLLCDMFDTVRGIVENMLGLVKVYGLMPNGSRIYYIKRSQPPLLIQMAASYHSCTNDHKFIKDNLDTFEQEFMFWYNNRMVQVEKDGKTYTLARYSVDACTPRPESYFEDHTLAQNLTTVDEKKHLYSAIKSAAESGWDFSSREMRTKGDAIGTLADLDTTNFIFVELNAILHANAVVLSEWYKFFKNDAKAQQFRSIADNLLNAIENVLWNEDVGVWQDWDLVTASHQSRFYPSNLAPLWTGSHTKRTFFPEKVLFYLMKEEIIKLDFSPNYYGTPTSLLNTFQQWDFPNCWAPIQAFVIQGLERSRHPIARYTAYKMAKQWIKSVYTGFSDKGYMYEKYSAVDIGTSGSGGEYAPQTGFGWTNGFVLELFNMWGKYLKSDDVLS